MMLDTKRDCLHSLRVPQYSFLFSNEYCTNILVIEVSDTRSAFALAEMVSAGSKPPSRKASTSFLSRKTSSIATGGGGGATGSNRGSLTASGPASSGLGALDQSERWDLLGGAGAGAVCTVCAAVEVARVEREVARAQARLNAYKSSELALRQQFRDSLGHITTAIEMHPNVAEYYLQKYSYVSPLTLSILTFHLNLLVHVRVQYITEKRKHV